ncbi:MAG TPA: hypothetical protein VIL48_13745 [Acidimicrobiales bacterium]
MTIRSPRRRTLAAAATLIAAALATLVARGEPASAEPTVPIEQRIDAVAHVARLGQDIEVRGGSFRGTVDLGTGAVVGDLSLPPASTFVNLVGLVPAARATFVMEPIGPAAGHVDLAGGTFSVTSTFDIHVPEIDPLGLGLANLSTPTCKTSTPITVTMSGPFNLDGASTFTGTFTIPPFQGCGLATTALNLLAPGPGNTFTATATPVEAAPAA